ncbi:short-chain dehydrogenase/reductase SDR [Streptomyces sp. CBMAI 2042]|uniref:hypothetical protein n=1 Tax=Streptomyces sp. CBMAI 2042 TaxID=2305222 RepID=UPI000F21A4CF|nr:hypothetical protein [Streptomyces sp. CBMAI 2042]RLV64592.1 short-chain dehydrogenase/reductase SDR [Streptomyces sp. CBMAI 2042]
MLTRQMADIAAERGWNPLSTGAHPGYTRTNLQTAGASLGRDKPKRSLLNSFTVLPSQLPEQGAEPLLYAAAAPGPSPAATTDRAAVSGSSDRPLRPASPAVPSTPPRTPGSGPPPNG